MGHKLPFLPRSIYLIADQNEILLDEEASKELSRDVACRIGQVIEKASTFMRHNNRSNLTCDDINTALKWLGCQPVYGYACQSNCDLKYSFVKGASVYTYDEDVVDLKNKVQDPPNITNKQEPELRLKFIL